MPKYLVELHDGRKFQVEADAPPSEADVLAQIGDSGEAIPAVSSHSTTEAPPASFSALEHPFDAYKPENQAAIGRESWQQAKEHPVYTAAMVGLPSAIGKAASVAKPLVSIGARRVATALENPLAGAAVGGIEGYRRGGLADVPAGMLYGAAGSTVLGPAISKVVKLSSLRTVPEGRLVTPEIPPVTPTPATYVPTPGPSMASSHVPSGEGELWSRGGWTPEIVRRQAAQGRPINPEVLRAPPRPENRGGTLVPVRAKTPTLEQRLSKTLRQGESIPRTESVSLPDDVTGPSVTMSPSAEAIAKQSRLPRQAEALEDTMRQRAQGADVPLPPEATSVERSYRELARKPILSPEDAARLEQLQRISTERARHVGMSYASGGKGAVHGIVGAVGLEELMRQALIKKMMGEQGAP